jgi:hypothetical protein
MELLDEADERNRLISYYYLSKNYSGDIREKALKVQYPRQEGDFHILDSGAFSAWRQGERIDLFGYIDAIHQVEDLFTHFVCLDVIDDPVISEAHHRIMLEEGCKNLIPVFHAGESMAVLNYMVGRGYSYIGISPNNDWIEARKVAWLRDVWTSSNLSETMTHGFGYMGLRGIGQVDMTTADSAQWIFNGAMGGINTSLGQVRITDRMLHDSSHLSRLPDASQKVVRDWIAELDLFSLEELKESYKHRQVFNVVSLRLLVEKAAEDRLSLRYSESGRLFGDEDASGFGYTEPFSEDAVEEAVKAVRSGYVKPMPRSHRAPSREKKSVGAGMEVLF